jgi:hypothetical protein
VNPPESSDANSLQCAIREFNEEMETCWFCDDLSAHPGLAAGLLKDHCGKVSQKTHFFPLRILFVETHFFEFQFGLPTSKVALLTNA